MHGFLEGPWHADLSRSLLFSVRYSWFLWSLQPMKSACSMWGCISCRDIQGPLTTSSLPAVPHPWLGCPQPHEGAAQALWVRKRNDFVSKLGLDVIVGKSQKLSGQTPQKLGKLLSRTSENRRTLYKYHLPAIVVPCSYPASICVKNSKNKTSEN